MLGKWRFFFIIAMMLHTEGDKDRGKHKENVRLDSADEQLERHKWQDRYRRHIARHVSNHDNEHFAGKHVAEQTQAQGYETGKLSNDFKQTDKRHDGIFEWIDEVSTQVPEEPMLSYGVDLNRNHTNDSERKGCIHIGKHASEHRYIAIDRNRPNKWQYSYEVVHEYDEK